MARRTRGELVAENGSAKDAVASVGACNDAKKVSRPPSNGTRANEPMITSPLITSPSSSVTVPASQSCQHVQQPLSDRGSTQLTTDVTLADVRITAGLPATSLRSSVVANRRSSLWRSTRWLRSHGAPNALRAGMKLSIVGSPVMGLNSLYCNRFDVSARGLGAREKRERAHVGALGRAKLLEIHTPLQGDLAGVATQVNRNSELGLHPALLEDHDVVLPQRAGGGQACDTCADDDNFERGIGGSCSRHRNDGVRTGRREETAEPQGAGGVPACGRASGLTSSQPAFGSQNFLSLESCSKARVLAGLLARERRGEVAFQEEKNAKDAKLQAPSHCALRSLSLLALPSLARHLRRGDKSCLREQSPKFQQVPSRSGTLLTPRSSCYPSSPTLLGWCESRLRRSSPWEPVSVPQRRSKASAAPPRSPR